jgi:hypothetical protein
MADISNSKIIKYTGFTAALLIGVMLTNVVYGFLLSPLEVAEVRPLLENTKTYQNVEPLRCKPNPLILLIKSDADQNVILNSRQFGNFKDLSKLQYEIRRIFDEREAFDAHQVGTNKISKEIIIIPDQTLRGENLFKLAEMLEQSGADSILIDWEQQFKSLEIAR